MGNFCTQCGAPLIPGQPHICRNAQQGTTPGQDTTGFASQFDTGFAGQSGTTGTQTGFQGQTGTTGTQGGFRGQTGTTGTQGGFRGQGGTTGTQGGTTGTQGGTTGTQTGNTGNQGGFVGQTGRPVGNETPDNGPEIQPAITINASGLRQWWITLKNRIGIGDPESNSDGVYERGMQIVPENLSANEGEKPIRQYDVAVLRSRAKLARAEGRLQVTNKRLIFRATGRSIQGKTTLQHEFALDDLKGFEIHKDYRFSLLDLLLSLVCITVAGGAFGYITTMVLSEHPVLGSLLGIAFGVGGVIPFFYLFRMFFVKMLCAAAGTYSTFIVYNMVRVYARYTDSFGWSLLTGLSFLTFVAAILTLLVSIFLFCFKPNLVFDIKTMGGGAPIQIRAKSRAFSLNQNDYTGFSEVLPAADTERALREVGALINDVQKMGDRAIEAWAKETKR
jgi:hypothetical protein